MKPLSLLASLSLGAALTACSVGTAGTIGPPGATTSTVSVTQVTPTLTLESTPTSGPSAPPSAGPSPSAGTTTSKTGTPSVTASVPKPDPNAGQQIPDVGQMPDGFKLPRTGYQLAKIEAITFCKVVWYPTLAQRQASRFRMAVSETVESGGADGVVIMTSVAAAEKLMGEIRDAASACLPSTPTRAAKKLTVPLAGPWEDSVAVARETLVGGQPTVEAYGTAIWVVRTGRVIVGTTDWTMYAQPVTGEAFEDGPALIRLSAMLKAAKA